MRGSCLSSLAVALALAGCGSAEKERRPARDLDATPSAGDQAPSPVLTLIAGARADSAVSLTGVDNGLKVPLEGAEGKILFETGPFKIISDDAMSGDAKVSLPKSLEGLKVHVRSLVNLPQGSTPLACTSDKQSGALFCDSAIRIASQADGSGSLNLADLSLEVDLDGDGKAERLPLFDNAFEGIFWRRGEAGTKLSDIKLENENNPYPGDEAYPPEPEYPTEPDYPREPDMPREPDRPKGDCCGCCCDQPHKEPRDPDDPDLRVGAASRP